MSHLVCGCGHDIADLTDDLPYKAELYCDQDFEALWGRISRDLAEFAEMKANGSLSQWIDKHKHSGYPRDLSDESLISDHLWAISVPVLRRVLECERCGTVWIQVHPEENRYEPFTPERPGYKAILTSRSRINPA